MGQWGQTNNMDPKRLRSDLGRWAEKVLHHAVDRVTASFGGTTDAGVSSDTEEGPGPSWREKAARKVQDVLLQDMDIMEEVSHWIDEHGEDAWLRVMGQLERISREVVDEMMDDPYRARRRRSAQDKASILARWDRAARGVAERVVDVMMEPPHAAKKRRRRPSADARAEVHEYTGDAPDDG